MNQEEKQLYKTFEKEVWFYLDKSLPDERQIYWDRKILENPFLKNYLDEYFELSNDYKSDNYLAIDNQVYNVMIEKAISKDSILTVVKKYISGIFSSDREFAFGKIAFASFLIVAAIIISIVSNRPNPVKEITNNINNELLEWNAVSVDNHMNKISNLLKLAKDEDYRRYSKYGLTSDKVDKNIDLIGNNIKELKNEIRNKEL